MKRSLFLASIAAIVAVGSVAYGGLADPSSDLNARILQSSTKPPSILHRAATRRKAALSSSSSTVSRLRPRDRDMIPSYAGGTFSPSVTYQKAGCGDKLIIEPETCDDGNLKNGDGCSASCTEEQGYACYGQPSRCQTACGDGVSVATESCDDGNLNDGDGCSSTCHLEFGFRCTADVPNVCTLLSQSSSSSS